MREEELPIYEVEEVSLEEAIRLLASEQEKEPADCHATPEHPQQRVA